MAFMYVLVCSLFLWLTHVVNIICSAGCGRTGTLIGIDIAHAQLLAKVRLYVSTICRNKNQKDSCIFNSKKNKINYI